MTNKIEDIGKKEKKLLQILKYLEVVTNGE